MAGGSQFGGKIRPIASSGLSLEEELQARVRLAHALQMSLEPEVLLEVFFQQLQTFVAVEGIQYQAPDSSRKVRAGRNAKHHCDYRLNTDNTFIGEIVFSRNRRFTETELARLESLLGSLIYPLRNALTYHQAVQASLVDPLTGVGNRAALDSALNRELRLAQRHQHEFSMLLIDVDHFKQINDEHGHSRGDQVLHDIAHTIQAVCRASDMTFRYGGEEFVVLLSKTDATGARIIAERIRAEVNKLCIGYSGKSIRPTVSIGISGRRSTDNDLVDSLFDRADKALYHAKQQGRNCIMAEKTVTSC